MLVVSVTKAEKSQCCAVPGGPGLNPGGTSGTFASLTESPTSSRSFDVMIIWE